MTVKAKIEEKLDAAFSPDLMELHNESGNHNVPAGSETHFKLVLVSSAFEGLGAVKRHQAVYSTLQEELAGPVHALSLHLFSPGEWDKRGGEVADSPECRGGSKEG